MKINRVGFSKEDHEQDYETFFAWDDYGVKNINGGSSGIVVGNKSTRGTAFFEFHDPRVGFIRGEAETLFGAERDAWQKFARILGCPGHDYIAGKHTDGSGVCRYCDHHKQDVFTAAELGQFCHVCEIPTFQKIRAGFSCDEHHPASDKIAEFKALKGPGAFAKMFTLMDEIREAGMA